MIDGIVCVGYCRAKIPHCDRRILTMWNKVNTCFGATEFGDCEPKAGALVRFTEREDGIERTYQA